MREQLTNANVHIRSMAVLFLGTKGEAADAARIEALQSDTTAITGPGWSAQQLPHLGGVARRARESLRRALTPTPTVPTTARPAG
jgi:hypothetical protein